MYIGIDLGTSSVKIVLIDEQQKLIAQANAALTVSHPKPLWSEQNPADWWQATCEAMDQLRQTYAPQLASVKAIGLSGQMHGATLLDKNDQVLRPAMLWNDGRALAESQELEDRVSDYAQIIGNRIMPGFTAPKVLWVAKHEPEIFQKTAKILLPKDYIRLRITNGYATDLSDASGTAWLNVGERTWSTHMLEATGLTEQHMPTVYEGSESTGCITPEIAKLWGLPKNTIVAGGAGDNAAAAICVNVISPGTAFLSLGTSGVYFVADKAYRPNPAGYVHTFCHCLPKLWHQMTVHLSAASCLSWLAKTLHTTTRDLLTELENAQEDLTDVSSQEIFLPYLSGERTPYNNPYARGVFFGLSHASLRPNLTRAVLEGVAFAFANGQDEMIKANTSINEVSVVGGGARSLYWGRILSSALNRPLIYRKDREAGAAIGAARLGWLAHNKKDPLSAFQSPPIETIIEPDSNLVEIYQKKRSIFNEIYQQLEGVFEKNF